MIHNLHLSAFELLVRQVLLSKYYMNEKKQEEMYKAWSGKELSNSHRLSTSKTLDTQS